jgi:hypothetical protein
MRQADQGVTRSLVRVPRGTIRNGRARESAGNVTIRGDARPGSHGIPPMVPRRSGLRAVRAGLAWSLLKASRFCPWRRPVGRPVSIIERL